MTQVGTASVVAALISLWAAVPSWASSSPPPSSAMRTGDETTPPSGFVAFCRRVPTECAPHGLHDLDEAVASIAVDATEMVAISAKSEQTHVLPTARHGRDALPNRLMDRITLTAARWVELQTVNIAINRAIKPLTDLEAFGRYEYWTMPLAMEKARVGDCEDFALEKRRALIERGWSERTLRLATLIAPTYGRHAVLVIVTDKGDYVLDNLNEEVKPWTETNYDWQSRQDPDDPLRWVTISNLRFDR